MAIRKTEDSKVCKSQIRDVPIECIKVKRSRRPLNEEKIQEIASSISQADLLLHPITVTTKLELVAGRHRLEAAKRLGWKEIPCLVASLDNLRLELVTIDENLVRASQTCLEAYEALARRGEILDGLGLRRKAGRPPKNPDTMSGIKTTAQIAAESRRSEKTMQRAQRIVGDIPKEVRDLIRGTGAADSLAELKRLASIDKKVQRRVAKRLAKEPDLTVKRAHRHVCPEAFPMAAEDGAADAQEPERHEDGLSPLDALNDAWDRADRPSRREFLRRLDVARMFRELSVAGKEGA